MTASGLFLLILGEESI